MVGLTTLYSKKLLNTACGRPVLGMGLWLMLLLLGLAGCAILGPRPAGEKATVVDIIDGDTIDVRLNGVVERLRYIGLDTPERGDPLYADARDLNEALVLGQTVRLVADVSERDRFGRLLRYVYLPDGTFVNGELVRLGLAEVRAYPPDTAQHEALLALQEEAIAARRGLWALVLAPNPVGTPTPTPAGPVAITLIFFNGALNPNEPDEYVVITNRGQSPVNLADWRLNSDDPGQEFRFPPYELQPGQSCRVYTNELHPEHCGFSFASRSALWRNAGECGRLLDPTGATASTYCYGD